MEEKSNLDEISPTKTKTPRFFAMVRTVEGWQILTGDRFTGDDHAIVAENLRVWAENYPKTPEKPQILSVLVVEASALRTYGFTLQGPKID